MLVLLFLYCIPILSCPFGIFVLIHSYMFRFERTKTAGREQRTKCRNDNISIYIYIMDLFLFLLNLKICGSKIQVWSRTRILGSGVAGKDVWKKHISLTSVPDPFHFILRDPEPLQWNGSGLYILDKCLLLQPCTMPSA